MNVLTAILLALHLIGLALVVGTFIVQMRAKSGFRTDLLLAGAIVQLVTGGAMFGLLAGETWFDHLKYGVHGAIGVVVLGAAIGAFVAQRRGARVQPWFHAAGGLGLINLLVAVLWRQYT